MFQFYRELGRPKLSQSRDASILTLELESVRGRWWSEQSMHWCLISACANSSQVEGRFTNHHSFLSLCKVNRGYWWYTNIRQSRSHPKPSNPSISVNVKKRPSRYYWLGRWFWIDSKMPWMIVVEGMSEQGLEFKNIGSVVSSTSLTRLEAVHHAPEE